MSSARICGRTCGCDDICPRAEAVAEDRKYGRDHNVSAVDQEQGRYEAWLDRIGGSA